MANGGNNGSDRGSDTHWQKRKMKRKIWVVKGNKQKVWKCFLQKKK